MSGLVTRIKQIIPADGWLAIYISKDPPYYFTDKLACFGIVRKEYYNEKTNQWEENDEDNIVGFACISTIDAVEEDDNFLCYCHESEVEEYKDGWTIIGREREKAGAN